MDSLGNARGRRFSPQRARCSLAAVVAIVNDA